MPRSTTTKPKSESASPLRVRPLRRNDFGVIERLFGARGACGGCWCMAWRSEFGGKRWRAQLGEPNKVAFARMVAFAIEQPDDVDVNEILFRPTRQEL